MYIGSTGSKGFFHLLYEILANAIDEAQAGYAKNIEITLTREEGIDVAEVQDDGEGHSGGHAGKGEKTGP